MAFLTYTIWLLPILVIIAAFFTSGVRRYQSFRLGMYFIVLAGAFLLNLTSRSFRVDILDFVLELLILMVFADLLWRGVRKKNMLLRFGALLLGLVFFILAYKDWALNGTASVVTLKNAVHLSTFKAHKKIYFVKESVTSGERFRKIPNITLYRTYKISPFEQQMDRFEIPEGYENSPLTFSWTPLAQSISVQIIGDHDTLWTLGEPLPQR